MNEEQQHTDSILLVLGEAGAGKSTFINDVTSTTSTPNFCNVSSKKSEDGTITVMGPYQCRGFKLIDTVGLSSQNFHNSAQQIYEKLRDVKASHAAVLLVVRRNALRWTTWLRDFNDKVSQLFTNELKIIIYWTGLRLTEPHTETDESDEEELRQKLASYNSRISCTFLKDDDRHSPNFPDIVSSLVRSNINRLIQPVKREPVADIAPNHLRA